MMRWSSLLLVLALLLTACTRTGGGTNGGAGNPWTEHGTVRVGNSDEPDNLNPLYSHTDAADQVQGLLYSSMFRYDDDGNFIPDLATDVPTYQNGGISKDGRTITIHLRKDARWSDGKPLTSRDWLYTYRIVKSPKSNVKETVGWDDIASADAPDPYTIVVHLRGVNSGILGIFAFGGAAYPPLPEHVLGNAVDLTRSDFNSHPLSSGPFVLQQWNRGSSLVFTPNPYSFHKPRVAKIVWKVIPSGNTLFAQLQAHEIDVVSGVNENDVERAKTISGIVMTKKLIANWRHLGINMSRPALRDVRVRRAIAEGIDWSQINATTYHGYNELATSDIYPGSWAAPNIPRYPYDTNDAKRLLTDAGWTPGPNGVLQKNGQPLSLTISTGTNKQENQEAEVQIQNDLRRLGIDIIIRNYPVSLLFDRALGPLYTGRYDLEWSVDTNAPDPDNACLWASDCIPPHGANTSWLRDPIVDQTSHAATGTFDRAQRKALYQREEERIHDLVPAVFFYWENSFVATNSDLKNFKPAAFVQDTWNAWQWEI